MAALADATAVESRQAWRTAPESEFRPTRVKVGWKTEALVVYAELEDADIFNPETRFNAPSFQVGDVFEMFQRPCDQAAYYEIHVTPANQKLQLRIPSAQALTAPRAQPGIPAEWFVNQQVIASRVEVNPAAERWVVAVAIPFDLVCEVSRPKPGARWLFSFSRYDYTRGRERPVLSSTSPHTILNFHRQAEWGELQFRLP